MRVKNLLLVSAILVSACAQSDFEQKPAPFEYSGGAFHHKNGTQRVSTYQGENVNPGILGSRKVNYIDSQESILKSSSTQVRSKPLTPINSKYDEKVRISSDAYRPKPVMDDSQSMEYARADISDEIVARPKPNYNRPIRGGNIEVEQTEIIQKEPVRNSSDYLDLSKVKSFEPSGNELSGISPKTKPAYNEIETAAGKAQQKTMKPAVETRVKEVEIEQVEVAEIEVEQPVIMPNIESVKPPKPSISKGRFLKPIDGQIISEFGDRSDGTFNDGINIEASEGSPVKAAAGGSVVYSGNQLQGYGNLVIVRHEDGYLTAYAHLKDLDLEKGQTVKQGDIIGKVGKTGNVDRPQLHFGVRKGREPVNPKDFL